MNYRTKYCPELKKNLLKKRSMCIQALWAIFSKRVFAIFDFEPIRKHVSTKETTAKVHGCAQAFSIIKKYVQKKWGGAKTYRALAQLFDKPIDTRRLFADGDEVMTRRQKEDGSG